MERITIRDTSSDLPVFPEDMELTQLSSLVPSAGRLSRFSLADLRMRALDLQDATLQDGKVHSVQAENASMKRVSARSLQFTECNIGMLRWHEGKISKVWFNDCKLLGARFDQVVLEHVAFTNCKLDYSTFSQVRASGPVMFDRCSLREVDFEGCNLTRALFDECDLFLANFGSGRYAKCDLRGSDLSTVKGVNNLKSAIIDRGQLLQLAEAMASEPDLTFGDDL
jgi:uncharacterized protein YjbI with pentapeptide repeats